jgi:hypothetical protein
MCLCHNGQARARATRTFDSLAAANHMHFFIHSNAKPGLLLASIITTSSVRCIQNYNTDEITKSGPKELGKVHTRVLGTWANHQHST